MLWGQPCSVQRRYARCTIPQRPFRQLGDVTRAQCRCQTKLQRLRRPLVPRRERLRRPLCEAAVPCFRATPFIWSRFRTMVNQFANYRFAAGCFGLPAAGHGRLLPDAFPWSGHSITLNYDITAIRILLADQVECIITSRRTGMFCAISTCRFFLRPRRRSYWCVD
jgi:hypothetical protein